jgi:hypothetical protein
MAASVSPEIEVEACACCAVATAGLLNICCLASFSES